MEFKERAFRAPTSARRYEGALAGIAPPDGALDLVRDVTRGGLVNFIRPGTDGWAVACVGRQGELGLLDSFEQQRKGSIEDHAGIPVRNLAAEESLEASELLVSLRADRELYAEALGGRRLDDRSRRRNERSC